MTTRSSNAESGSVISEREKSVVSYQNKSILVTGGRGHIGSSLIQALSAIPCTIVSLSRERSRIDLPVSGVAHLIEVEGDIREQAVWQRVLRDANVVFHFAGQTSAYVANDDPMADLKVNGIPVLQLLEICRRQRLSPKVLFAGTVTEVGVPARLPVDEATAEYPITIYDIHKLLAEKYLRFYAAGGIVPAVTLRLSNVYGPGPRTTTADRGVLNRMIRRALEGKSLDVYGEGNLVRDYIFIEDVVRAFLTAGANMDAVSGNYYVIGTGIGHRIIDAVNLVADRAALKTGRRPQVQHVPPPSGLSPIEDRNFIADTTRFRSITGWVPQVSLVEGIDRTLDYYLDHMAVGWRRSL